MGVKEEAMNHGLHISPEGIMTDFELALVQLLELEFPGAHIHGCYFHFAQSLWRKVQRLGLVEEYKEDAFVRRFVRVRVSWDGLKAEMPDDDKVKGYSEYFDQTWMSGQFAPRMWNYYAHSGPRTNNHIMEGWHNRMKRICEEGTPELLRGAGAFSARTSCSRSPSAAGGRWFTQTKKEKVVQREKIKSLQYELMNGERHGLVYFCN